MSKQTSTLTLTQCDPFPLINPGYAYGVQGQDEPVENFITDLYHLAEFCEYGTLKDEMIRDRLVVGLKSDKHSEKRQKNSGLTLEQAVQQARQSENVKKQRNKE